jgi:Ca2+-binding RTX toxin-like protein
MPSIDGVNDFAASATFETSISSPFINGLFFAQYDPAGLFFGIEHPDVAAVLAAENYHFVVYLDDGSGDGLTSGRYINAQSPLLPFAATHAIEVNLGSGDAWLYTPVGENWDAVFSLEYQENGTFAEFLLPMDSFAPANSYRVVGYQLFSGFGFESSYSIAPTDGFDGVPSGFDPDVTSFLTIAGNQPPTYSIRGTLTILENAAIGAVIGRIAVRDPEGDAVTTFVSSPFEASTGLIRATEDFFGTQPGTNASSVFLTDGLNPIGPIAIAIRVIDVQEGTLAVDPLTGTELDDHAIIVANTAAETFSSGNGDDTAFLQLGGPLEHLDGFDGGLGSDTADFSKEIVSVWVDLAYPGAQAWTSRSIDYQGSNEFWATLTGVENIVGTSLSDAVWGDVGDNTYGFVGTGSAFIDYFNGREGDDTADFSRMPSAVWVDLEWPDTQAWGSNESYAIGVNSNTQLMRLIDVENITGTYFSDTALGNTLDNTYRFIGNDTSNPVVYDHFDGRGGSDTIDFSLFDSAVWVNLAFAGPQAWTSDDFLATGASATRAIATLASVENATGSAFDDFVAGASGANVIDGGLGNDFLFGGGAADTFLFKPGFGVDIVRDFTDTDGADDDIIDLTHLSIADIDDISISDLEEDVVYNGTTYTGPKVEILIPDVFERPQSIIVLGATVASLSSDDFRFLTEV